MAIIKHLLFLIWLMCTVIKGVGIKCKLSKRLIYDIVKYIIIIIMYYNSPPIVKIKIYDLSTQRKYVTLFCIVKI